MTRVFVSLVEFAHQRARLVAAFALLLTAGLLYFIATHLGIDTSTDKMLDPNLPFLKADRAFEQAFPQFDDLLVVVINGANTTQAQTAADALAAKLKARPDLFATVYQPGRGEFFERDGLLYLDQDQLWKLNDRLTEAGPWLGRLSGDPSLVGLFGVLGDALTQTLSVEQQAAIGKVMDRVSDVAADTTHRLSWSEVMMGEGSTLGLQGQDFVLAQARLDPSSQMDSEHRALDALREFSHSLEQTAEFSGLRVRITGSVAMDAEELDTVARGAELSTGLSFVLVWLVLILALRSLKPAIAILLTLFCGLTWTAAFATFAIGTLNLISVSFAVLFIGLGVDFGIQFAMRYKEELDRGAPTREALVRAASGVGGALWLAATAAAACFFAFVPTAYRGLAELGMISGVGMFIALFANLTLLPALLTLLPTRASSPQTAFGNLLQSWGGARQSRHRAVLWAAAVAGLAGLALLPFARFDFNPLNMKDPHTEAVSTFFDLLKDANTTPYTVNMLAPSLEAAQAQANQLEKLPTVDKAVTFASYVADDQETKLEVLSDLSLVLGPGFLNPEPAPEHSNEDRATAIKTLAAALKHAPGSEAFQAQTQRLSQTLDQLMQSRGTDPAAMKDLETRLLGDLPSQLSQMRRLLTATAFGLNDLPQDLKARYVTPDGRARIEIFPKENLSDNTAMRRFVESVKSVSSDISGAPVSLLEGGRTVVRACLEASGIALIAIFVVLLIALRRTLYALLVLAPLALAALLTVASAVLVGLAFDLANLIALPLLVGIGVAFGIYLVHRWRSEPVLKEAMSSSTPRAIFFSAMTTMVSFGTLAFSPHRGMSHMGELLTMALTYALLCTLLILPALLSLTERRAKVL